MVIRSEAHDAKQLGTILQQARMMQGMSQRQLADELGISQKWVWEMEGGKPGIFTTRLFQVLRSSKCRLIVEIDNDDASDHG
jgi:HTH-type transcriptional regulator / antitoxin HipB